MPWARPTLTQLRDGALQDVAAARIYDATTGRVISPILLQFDPLTITAKVMAGLAYEEYGYLDYIALQATPATAEDEQALGWGGLVGVTLKDGTPASAVLYQVSRTMTRHREPPLGGVAIQNGKERACPPGLPPRYAPRSDGRIGSRHQDLVLGLTSCTAGVDVPVGTQLARADGALYSTTVDAVVASDGTVSLPFVAQTMGSAGAVLVGTTLSLYSGISGIAPGGTVTSVTAPRTDPDTIDQLKVRYLLRFASPPQGGATSDYEEWALVVPGVTRAWVLPLGMGVGTVVVYTMFDAAEAAHNGFPQGTSGVASAETRDVAATGDQLTVANALYPLRPTTALVYSVAPVPYSVSFTIQAASSVSSVTRTQVAAAIAGAFLANADPLGGKLPLSLFQTAIASVPGMPAFTLQTPSAVVQAPAGSLPVLGTVAYV